MGSAVYSALSPGDIFATLDMHIRFTRPALLETGDLSLTSSVIHEGKRLRIASCNVDNREGKRVAMATASALVVEGGARELTGGRLPEEILAGAEHPTSP
jgi:acyl-coenzyme A thioesterase PaaI-like protein